MAVRMLYKLSRTFARIMPDNILVLDLTSLGTRRRF
jgi:hypothetical protein